MITEEKFTEYNNYIRNNVELVLISGKAHSGKGVVAETLKNNYGFKEVGFADYLKKIAVNHFDWPYDRIHLNGKRTPNSRLFMQAIGEAGRLVSSDFWIRRLVTTIYRLASPRQHPSSKIQKKFVISDLRYVNEAEWGKLVGGQLWKVTRIGEFDAIEAGADHISETALSTFEDWDRVITNDSDLVALGAKISDPSVVSE